MFLCCGECVSWFWLSFMRCFAIFDWMLFKCHYMDDEKRRIRWRRTVLLKWFPSHEVFRSVSYFDQICSDCIIPTVITNLFIYLLTYLLIYFILFLQVAEADPLTFIPYKSVNEKTDSAGIAETNTERISVKRDFEGQPKVIWIIS